MTRVRFEHITKRFGDTVAVDDINLDIAAGELFFLLGPSGCGKSTLLRLIAGLHEPSDGRLWFNDRDVTSLGTSKRNAVMCFQSYALWPHLTVAENVRFGLKVRGASRAEQNDRIDEVLQLVQMDSYAARKPNQLSGGQQQRVALARSLAPRPDLLLLDEPFSSLDSHLRVSLREELRGLLKRLGLAALLVTHDQDEAFAFADRIGVMHAGRLEQWDSSFEVYHRPVSPFVARFVGEGRFLRARVLDANTVESTLGRLRTGAALTSAAGTAVHVLIRPDDVQPDGIDGIEAIVVSAAFRGAEIFYTLRLPDGEEVSALFPSHLQHAAGEKIRVRLDLEHVVVFGPDAKSGQAPLA